MDLCKCEWPLKQRQTVGTVSRRGFGAFLLSVIFLDHSGGTDKQVDGIQGYNVTTLFMMYMPNGLSDGVVHF